MDINFDFLTVDSFNIKGDAVNLYFSMLHFKTRSNVEIITGDFLY